MAYLAPDDGVLNVWVKTIGKNDDHPVTHDRDRGIHDYFWAWNNKQILFVQDKAGDENWHIYSIPAKGGEEVDLTPIDGIQARFISVKPEFPDIILVGINDRVSQLHDIHRIDLNTGERTLEVQNDIGAVGWSVDQNLIVRIGMLPKPDGGFSLLHRENPDSEWKPMLSWGLEDALGTGSAGFAADNETLYMLNSVGTNSAQMRTYNVHTGEEKVIASDPTYDVSMLFVNPITRKIQAVGFIKDRLTWNVLDPSIRADFDAIAKLHDGFFNIIDRDYADKTWLVVFFSDKGSPAYYAWDRGKKKGTFLFTARPELDKYTLAGMTPVSYETRDGLTIHGYLSLPPDSDKENLPTVMVIHGGPWVRDVWGYDPEAQWLANRDYAVLQINYRGSTGYGKEFTNAGDREWGGKMQDDISDGVKWLIDSRVADPNRIAIYGGSYGGYATLSGLTKTPGLFACGVDIVGPSNLITFQETIPPYWEPLKPMMYKRIGHPKDDAEFLNERSPLNHIDRIQAPLMIVQGKNDPRVKLAESIQIRDALRKAGKTVKYMEFEDEGHGFVKPENRLKFYAAAEKFLAEHLGGRYLP